MKLVGEVCGQVSDALHDANVAGFGEGGLGRLGLEAGGSAAIAAATGGNAGAAAASVIVGGLAAAQTRALAKQLGQYVSDDPDVAMAIANAVSNGVAAGAGAAAGAIVGGGHSSMNALNGAAAASALQQYNELHDTNPKKDVTDSTTNKILGWVASGVKTGLEGASYLPIIGDPVSLVLAGIDAAQGDYKGAALNLAAAGVGLYTWGMGKDILVGGAKGGKFLSEAVGDAVQKPNVTITDTTGKIGDNATSHEAVGEGKNTSANGNKGENGGSASGAEATNLDGKNPNTGKVGDNCATDECVTVHGKRPDKPTANSSSSFNQEYLDEMSKNGVKFSPDNLVKVEKLSDGRIVFLETGNSKAGLQHIVDEHGKEFAQMGVPESEIPNTIMDTLKNGKIVGYQGEGTGRPIYETVINGKKRRLAITVGNNGFIVGANSKGSIK